MTTTAALAAALTELLGPDAVSTGDLLTAAPGTADEAAQTLAAARAAGAAVLFRGGDTGQRIGLPPARAELVLETRRLDRLIEYEPADLTVCVEAGMTLARLQATLATHGQQAPIDAPVPARATVGGLVAANVCGPRRWAHGGWRDLTIGMHMALPDGTLIKSGGRVVKNVQGYDLAKLFTGALGTLGLITRVNLKVAPLPEVRRLLVARGSLPAIAAYLATVAASTVRVSTLDLLDADAATTIGLPPAHTSVAATTGLLLVEGPRDVAEAGMDALAAMARTAALPFDIIGGPGLDPLRAAWDDLGRTDDLATHAALLSISSLPTDVQRVVEAVRAAAGEHGAAVRVWARAGNGLTYAHLVATADPFRTLPAIQAALLPRWPTTLTAGDPAVARAARPWGAPPAALPLMRALKRRFDPDGVLQPGRYVYEG